MASLLMGGGDSCLVVIDVQEKLTPVMNDPRRVIDGSRRLLVAATRLGVPVIVTEQYPKGLGPTMIDLREVAPPESTVEKTSFSAMADEGFRARFAAVGRTQAVLCGIEAHVCVLQTALGLRQEGIDVFVVRDCCSSRHVADEAAAFERLRAAGVHLVTLEMVIFEWLGDSAHPAFKDVRDLIL